MVMKSLVKQIVSRYHHLKAKVTSSSISSTISNIDAKGLLNDGIAVVVDSIKILCFGYVIGHYGVSGTLCIGPSMLPTFDETGDVVFYDVFHYKMRGKRYEVGDVVIAVCPYDNTRTVCKRVRALEGQTIAVQHPLVPYPQVCTIPKGHVWLAGDNNMNSTDSRSYGPVPVGLLQGRVFVKFKALFGFIPYPVSITNQIPNENDVTLIKDDNTSNTTNNDSNNDNTETKGT